ncbi:MAG: type I-B CRISPR-associated protein Cas5b [Clostridia bacterium]
MKYLKLCLFQETACYKKPFAFKVAETYPLPPYSTVIGMLHKILQAKPGEYFPMNLSIQGDYESIFSNYQNLRMYKGRDQVTSMPRNVHQLFHVKLIIHIQAQDEIIDMLYQNIIMGKESFTLGRNEDMVRVDDVKIIDTPQKTTAMINHYNAYIPEPFSKEVKGIAYRLNTTYQIQNNLRKWNKINVKYVEKYTNQGLREVMIDQDEDCIFLLPEEPHLL